MSYLGWTSNTVGNLFFLGWLSEIKSSSSLCKVTISGNIDNITANSELNLLSVSKDTSKIHLNATMVSIKLQGCS